MHKQRVWVSVALGLFMAAGASGQEAIPPIGSFIEPLPLDIEGNIPADYQVLNQGHDCAGDDLAEAAEHSELVFDGVLINAVTTTPPGMSVLVTEYTFHIHELFKGERIARTITLRQTGGVNPDGSGVCTVHSHKLTVGGRYLVFVEHEWEGLLFPISKIFQVFDAGATVANQSGHVVIGLSGATPLVRNRPELPSLSYLGTAEPGDEPQDIGPPDRFSEPLPPQQTAQAAEDHGPIPAEELFRLLRAEGVRRPAGEQPTGLNSQLLGGPDYITCGYITGSINFRSWMPNNDNWAWSQTAMIDWNNLTNNSPWIFGLVTSGGEPIRNEAPVANNGRNNFGTPSSAQMSSGGYGTWAANGNPNGICFRWFSGGSCSRITETDVFANPAIITDQLQFRKTMVHELGHAIGLQHEDRYVAIMVSGTWRVPPNYVLGSYYNRRDDCVGGRAILNTGNSNGGSWTLRTWRDIATVSQAHPNWGSSGDVGPNVTSLSTYSAQPGQTIQIQRMYVENRGNQAYSGDVDLVVYLSPNNVISSTDYVVWSGGWSSFSANGFWNNGSLNITIPSTIPAGTYYVGWILSAAEAELVSNNNTGIMVRDSSGSFAQRTISITVPAPVNNNCSSALAIGNGNTSFSTTGATTDGPAEPNCNFCCGDAQINQDIWYRYTATCSGTVTIGLCNSSYDTKLAVYSGWGCPTSAGTAIACNDDACNASGGSGLQSRVSFQATQGGQYLVRVGGYNTASGSGTINIACQGCYANCDGSTTPPVLNVNDFVCFQQRFAAGNPYANCDGSTTPPILNVNDFVCFQQRFAAGCP